MKTPDVAAKRESWIDVLLGADAEERVALGWSFLFFFSLLLGYYILRSVREAMIAAHNVVPQVFTSVFVVMLVLTPIYGAIVSRIPRRRFLPVVYGSVICSLIVFSAAFSSSMSVEWMTLAFAIYLSVINLFTDSVFWSFMSDIFVTQQAKRFYSIIAVGGTCGAIAGPELTRLLVHRVGVPNLLLLSALFYSVCLFCIFRLLPWARTQEIKRQRDDGEKIIGGSMLAAFRLVVSKPLLFALVLFMVFGTSPGTLLYNAQAAVVHAQNLSDAARTEFFATVDLSVNVLALCVQLLLTRFLMTRLSAGAVVMIPVLILISGMASLTFAFSTILLTLVQVITRGLSFALVKPARESLFTQVDRESRYKAKNFIDTVVYRGGDVATSWGYFGLTAAGLGLPALAGIWTVVAMIWGAVVLWIIHLQRGHGAPPPIPRSSHDPTP